MNDSEGELAVQVARLVVDAEAKGKQTGHIDVPASFRENRGVFVTLHSYPSRLLRGCIGFPEPIFSLASALVQAAEAACHDPRFEDLQADELDSVVVEVTVLTPPEEIWVDDRKKLPSLVQIGKDGLIAEHGPFRGLLLPQVPVEWGWDAEEFLGQTCMKAGLCADMWLDERTKIYKFQGEIFSEETPRGRIVRKELG